MKRFVAQSTAEEIASRRRFPGRPENIIRVVKVESIRATWTWGVRAVFGSEDNDAFCGCAISFISPSPWGLIWYQHLLELPSFLPWYGSFYIKKWLEPGQLWKPPDFFYIFGHESPFLRDFKHHATLFFALMASSKREIIHKLNYVVDPTLTSMIFASSMPERAINDDPPFLLQTGRSRNDLGLKVIYSDLWPRLFANLLGYKRRAPPPSKHTPHKKKRIYQQDNNEIIHPRCTSRFLPYLNFGPQCELWHRIRQLHRIPIHSCLLRRCKRDVDPRFHQLRLIAQIPPHWWRPRHHRLEFIQLRHLLGSYLHQRAERVEECQYLGHRHFCSRFHYRIVRYERVDRWTSSESGQGHHYCSPSCLVGLWIVRGFQIMSASNYLWSSQVIPKTLIIQLLEIFRTCRFHT